MTASRTRSCTSALVSLSDDANRTTNCLVVWRIKTGVLRSSEEQLERHLEETLKLYKHVHVESATWGWGKDTRFVRRTRRGVNLTSIMIRVCVWATKPKRIARKSKKTFISNKLDFTLTVIAISQSILSSRNVCYFTTDHDLTDNKGSQFIHSFHTDIFDMSRFRVTRKCVKNTPFFLFVR